MHAGARRPGPWPASLWLGSLWLGLLGLWSLGQSGCVEGGVVLERPSVDASRDMAPFDAEPLGDGALLDAQATDAGVDAGPAGNVTVYLTGFQAYAGLTIRARLGALSGVIASAVIQPDGTAVIVLNQIITILSQTYFESYVDVDASGSCSSAVDVLAASNVSLVPEGDGQRADLDASDTSAPILGCLVLN